jgi:hypothetical protein
MVVFDASILLFVLDENTKASVPRAKERVEYLIDTLSKTDEKIVIPTPALSECLVHAGPAGPEYLTIIGRQACFRVASFDQRAAVEAAIRTYHARQRGQPNVVQIDLFPVVDLGRRPDAGAESCATPIGRLGGVPATARGGFSGPGPDFLE